MSDHSVSLDNLEVDIQVLKAEYDSLCWAECTLIADQDKLLRISRRPWITRARRDDIQRDIGRNAGAINVIAEYRRASLEELAKLRQMYVQERIRRSSRVEIPAEETVQ